MGIFSNRVQVHHLFIIPNATMVCITLYHYEYSLHYNFESNMRIVIHWVNWVHLELTYPNSPTAFYFLQASSTLAMSLSSIFLTYIHCCKLPLLYSNKHIFFYFCLSYFHSCPPSPLPFSGFGQTWTSPLCPPASSESHVGQRLRGCQGLLMTPSPAITSGWQLYLHKISRQWGEPAQSKWQTYKYCAKGRRVIITPSGNEHLAPNKFKCKDAQ